MVMNCLIIAAGEGSRLNGADKPKPLVTINNIPLIEYIIDNVVWVGIETIYVVLGYNRDVLEKTISKIAIRKKINIICIYNPDWRKGNGTSVLAAKRYITSPFILLMADHLFHRNMLSKLLMRDPPDRETVLAVDIQINENHMVDLDDVTRVFIKDDRIINIGKHIEIYNAFDTGMFLSSIFLFKALEEAATMGNFSLSDGIQRLIKEDLARVQVIDNACWIDIDTPDMLNKAKELISKDAFLL